MVAVHDAQPEVHRLQTAVQRMKMIVHSWWVDAHSMLSGENETCGQCLINGGDCSKNCVNALAIFEIPRLRLLILIQIV